jgi:hypothetical protein
MELLIRTFLHTIVGEDSLVASSAYPLLSWHRVANFVDDTDCSGSASCAPLKFTFFMWSIRMKARAAPDDTISKSGERTHIAHLGHRYNKSYPRLARQSILCVFTLWLLALFASASHESAHAQTVDTCLGPVANVQMKVPPTCQQAWAWHLFLRTAIVDFQARRDLFDAAERHALQGEQIFDRAVLVGETISNIVPKSGKATELLRNSIKESPWFAFNFFIEDEPANVAIAAELTNTVRSMYDAAVTSGADPWSVPWAALGLWNKTSTYLQTIAVVRGRQTINVVQEFLLEFYRFGGNSEPIAISLGLARDASIDQIIAAKANNLKYGPVDFSKSSAVEIIESYISHIGKLAAICVQTGECTAPRVRAYTNTVATDVSISSPASSNGDCKLPIQRQGLSGTDAAIGLGATTEYARYQAIYSMARGKQFRVPLCAGESAAMLKGTTGNNRALAIAELALVLKDDLSGDETAFILGTTQENSEYARFQAIYSLARAKKFKTKLGGDESKLILDGTTGNNRALAIAEIAQTVKSDLSGDEAALILGSAQESNEYARYQAIYSLARAKKFKAGLGGADLERILDGTSGNNRVLAVSELSRSQ